MKCPSCGSTRVYPSRLRGLLERLRQEMTEKQPYRCHQCGWRRWRSMRTHPEGPDARPEDLRTGQGPSPVSQSDLDRLDPLTPKP
jgi:transposase-like protein